MMTTSGTEYTPVAPTLGPSAARRRLSPRLRWPALLLGALLISPVVGWAQETNCTNGLDDDVDFRIDLDDSNCIERGWRAYPTPYPEAQDPCANNLDDDGDGLTDYGTLGTFTAGIGDSSCHEARCQDAVDNDGDGKMDGLDEDCYCFIDVVNGLLGLNFPSNYCVAEDVNFVLVGLGIQQDGCLNATDRLSIEFEARMKTKGKTRYDIGMWVSLDGRDAGNYPPNDRGLCGRQILRPASGPTGDCTSDPNTTCSSIANAPGFNSSLHDGPYETETQVADRDRCGEITKTWTDPVEDAVLDFVAPPAIDAMTVAAPLLAYDIPCTDIGVNPPGLSVTDGFIDVGTCSTWDQQAGTACNNFSEAYTKENPKCRCERTATDVPAPAFAMGCQAGPLGGDGVLTLGESLTNTVSVTNSVTGCTPDLATTERFRCGTASYLRIVVDYPEAYGTITASSDTPSNDDSRIDTGSTLVWTIKNTQTPNSLGIVGATALTHELSYTFLRNAVPFNGSLDFLTTTYWSDTLDFDTNGEPPTNGELTNLAAPASKAQLCAGCTCNAPIGTTPVTLAVFEAARAGAGVRFRWTTATEVANVGFNVYGKTAAGWVKLNAELIPAAGAGIEPQEYEVTLEVPAGVTTFSIEDVDRTGVPTSHREIRLAEQGLDSLAAAGAHPDPLAPRGSGGS